MGLSREEIADRVCVNSSALVDELHENAGLLVKNEEARSARLDGRAVTLLSGSGLALTLVLNFGGSILIGHSEFAHGVVGGTLTGLFCVAVFAAITSGTAALRVLYAAKNVPMMNPDVVFASGILMEADVILLVDKEDELDRRAQADSQLSGEAREQAERKGLSVYRRNMTAHLWEIANMAKLTNAEKARAVRLSQWAFAAFSLLVVALGIDVAGAAHFDHHPTTNVGAETHGCR